MYVVVALAAFSAQLNLGTEDFDVAGLGTTGCFAAMFIGYLSCMAFSKLRRCHKLMLEQYTAGMAELPESMDVISGLTIFSMQHVRILQITVISFPDCSIRSR